MMIYPTRGDPNLVFLDTIISSGMAVRGCRILREQVWLHPLPHLMSTQTGSRLLPPWYSPHNCTLLTYTQTSLHLPPKLRPISPRSPDEHCSSVCSLEFPGPARSGSPCWVPTGQWHSGTLLSSRWVWWHPDTTGLQTLFNRDIDIELHLLTHSKAWARSIYMVSCRITLKTDGKPISSLNPMFKPQIIHFFFLQGRRKSTFPPRTPRWDYFTSSWEICHKNWLG